MILQSNGNFLHKLILLPPVITSKGSFNSLIFIIDHSKNVSALRKESIELHDGRQEKEGKIYYF